MLRRQKQTKSWFKIAIFIFSSSVLILISLCILFIPGFLFRKPVISPIAVNQNTKTPDMEKLLTNANIAFSFVNLASDYYDINIKDNGRVYISNKKNIDSQISSLQAILKQLTINGKRFKIIDFRFDKPIIIF